jgi:arginine-tRNA-protein transferase
MTDSSAKNTHTFQFGITAESPCSYLPERQERLLVAIDEQLNSLENSEMLFASGFRRSGEQVYRPYCEHCHACQAIRIPVNEFKASRSQKRLLNKNAHFELKISLEVKSSYYPLYSQYINAFHHDGAMYPPNEKQFSQFIQGETIKQHYLELWDNDTLISVAVTDIFLHSCSALYTFYHSDYRQHSLGIYSILKQIAYSRDLNKDFLYLGYQIDACNKMNYKTKFFPHQRLQNNCWNWINK